MNLLNVTLMAGVKIENIARWCRENGVPVRTFYRHRNRIQAEGEWRERSRRPHRSAAQTPADLDGLICKLRAGLAPDNGADYIRDALIAIHAETRPSWRVPSRSTINRVLDRHNLLERNPAKRPRSSWRRFCYARPRDCYQIDATTITLAGGGSAVAVEVLDDCTRTLVACHAAAAETTDAAIAAITKAVDEYGPPALVLSDNGAAFTNRHRRPTVAASRFARTLLAWGTRLIHSSPYHPQTCGKVERHHQTLKRWLAAHLPPVDLADLQRLLDAYRDYYNNRRCHSALAGRSTPHQAWANATSLGGPSNLPIQTDATVHRCPVYANGTIGVGHQRIGVGKVHRGTTLTVIRDNDHATIYTPDGQPLAHLPLPADGSYTSINRAA